jgi:hypothetical protein
MWRCGDVATGQETKELKESDQPIRRSKSLFVFVFHSQQHEARTRTKTQHHAEPVSHQSK